MEGLIEGRIVHFVMDSGYSKGEHRPAIVVKVWRKADGSPPDNGCCNLQVVCDSDGPQSNDGIGPLLWATSRVYSETHEPGTWHWVERA